MIMSWCQNKSQNKTDRLTLYNAFQAWGFNNPISIPTSLFKWLQQLCICWGTHFIINQRNFWIWDNALHIISCGVYLTGQMSKQYCIVSNKQSLSNKPLWNQIVDKNDQKKSWMKKASHFITQIWWLDPSTRQFSTGLADLNHLDLNHRFKSRFKSTDFFIKISDLNQYFLFFFKLPSNQSCFG